MNKQTSIRRLAAVAATVALATGGGLALASTSSAAAVLMPASHSGDNGALQISVTGTYLNVTSWKASSVGAPVTPTPSVRVDFIEYNQNPINVNGREIISESHVYLGKVSSFTDVSAPASAVNRNYANGHFLCIQSNAFHGRPCAQIIG